MASIFLFAINYLLHRKNILSTICYQAKILPYKVHNPGLKPLSMEKNLPETYLNTLPATLSI